MRFSRRGLLRGALLFGGGAAAGAAATRLPSLLGPDRLPLSGGYAPAADVPGAVRHPGTEVTYYVQTDEPVVAFTFDDGPGVNWTTMVLDTLDDFAVPATFFVVGRNLSAHADVVRGRLDRHAVGNHSWSHQMHEARYKPNPEAQVRDIVDNVVPGSIVLAHDVGNPDRLVALRHLGEMFGGLKKRGFRFVTVPELMSMGRAAVVPPGV